MTALYVVLGILLFILILLLFNVKFYITYTDKLHIKIKYFFTFSFDDMVNKKPKKSSKPKAEKKPKAKPKKESSSPWRDIYEENGIGGLINILKYIVNTVKKSSKTLINHLIVNKLKIVITVADEDAAETAIKYGRTCSAVYPLIGILLSNLNCKSYEASVQADFNKNETELDCFAYVKIRLMFISAALLKALWAYFYFVIKTAIANAKADDKN